METIKAEEQKEKRLMKCDLWDTVKRTNKTHCGSPRRRKEGAERMFKEIITKTFRNLMKDMNINIQAQQSPSNTN